MTSRMLLAGVAGCVMLCGTAVAQTGTKQPPKPVKPETPTKAPAEPAAPTLEDYAKATAPGENQKRLEQLSGAWDAVIKMRMAPDAPWSESKGSERAQMWYDGRYLHTTFKGDMMGQEFKGLGLMAYNNATKQFESTWIDSLSTGIISMTGSYDASGKSFTFTGEESDPLTGKKRKIREVTRLLGADKRVSEFYAPGPDGKDYKSMEISYTRKAESDDDDRKDKPEHDGKPGKGKDDKPAKK